jgi:hypothetical protein
MQKKPKKTKKNPSGSEGGVIWQCLQTFLVVSVRGQREG